MLKCLQVQGKGITGLSRPQRDILCDANNYAEEGPVHSHQCLPGPPSQQSKMEDRLDEAIHVLRSHAVGTAADLHGLLPGHGALTTSFAGPMSLGGRHTGLVSIS